MDILEILFWAYFVFAGLVVFGVVFDAPLPIIRKIITFCMGFLTLPIIIGYSLNVIAKEFYVLRKERLQITQDDESSDEININPDDECIKEVDVDYGNVPIKRK